MKQNHNISPIYDLSLFYYIAHKITFFISNVNITIHLSRIYVFSIIYESSNIRCVFTIPVAVAKTNDAFLLAFFRLQHVHLNYLMIQIHVRNIIVNCIYHLRVYQLNTNLHIHHVLFFNFEN